MELRRQESLAGALLRQLGAGAPGLRLALGTVSERIGRLKPNGRFLRASPLAPVFELEVLESLLDMTGALLARPRRTPGWSSPTSCGRGPRRASAWCPSSSATAWQRGARALVPLGGRP